MIQIFLKSLIIGYSGALMPGSLLTYTIDKSIRNGAKAGLIISIGHALLELILVLLLLFGFGRYLGTELAKTIIGIAGGLVLSLFGISMIRDVYLNKISVNFNDDANKKQGNMIVTGAVITASNPYFIFWWAVVGLGLIMSSYNALGILGVALFYIGHILSDITWYSFISVVVSKSRAFINQKVYRITIAILGVFLIGFGVSFLLNSIGYIVGHI